MLSSSSIEVVVAGEALYVMVAGELVEEVGSDNVLLAEENVP